MQRPAGRFSLRKDERVLESRQFRWVLRGGERFRAAHFTVIHRRCSGPSKLGLTVSRKVGNAVVRNRVKRLVREVYRHRKEMIPEPRALVVIAQNGAGLLSAAQVRQELEPLFRELQGRRLKKGAPSAPKAGVGGSSSAEEPRS